MIRGYIITLLEEYSGTLAHISVEGNTTSYDFQDLHPAYIYALKMAAITVSQGPYSDVVKVETEEDSEYLFFICCSQSVIIKSYQFSITNTLQFLRLPLYP